MGNTICIGSGCSIVENLEWWEKNHNKWPGSKRFAAGREQAAYAAYREARGEMKKLLTVKANVDRILGRGGQEPEPDAIRQISCQRTLTSPLSGLNAREKRFAGTRSRSPFGERSRG